MDTNVGGFVSTSPLAVSTPARTSLAVGSLSHAKHTRRLRAQLLYTGGTPQLSLLPPGPPRYVVHALVPEIIINECS